LSETNPNLPSLRFETSLYGDCESCPPLESNFVDNAPSTDLKEVFDASVTSLPLAALSSPSTLVATSISDLVLLASHWVRYR